MGAFASLLKVQEELSALAKTEQNKQQGWAFRGIDSVMNALHPLFVKHKVIVIPEVLSIKNSTATRNGGGVLNYCKVKVKYTFCAEEGSTSCIMVGEAMDTGDKATSKALSIAYKYAMFQTFCIPTEDDPDRDVYEATPNTNKTKQKINIAPENVIKEVEQWKKTKVLNKQQLDALTNLVSNYNESDYNYIKGFIGKFPDA